MVQRTREKRSEKRSETSPKSLSAPLSFTGRQKGGFVKGWFWRMYPHSGFRSRRTCERTLIPVFVPGEHPNVPSFQFSFRGNIRQNHPFGKPPFWKTTLLSTPDSCCLKICHQHFLKFTQPKFSTKKSCSPQRSAEAATLA